MKIFVYGTLKRGYGNNRLLSGCEFLGEAVTAPKYDLKARGIPFLVHGNYAVHGEVYEADEETVYRMDLLEGHPNFYHRGDIVLGEFSPVSGELWSEVQAYFFNEENPLHANVIPLSEDGTKVWGSSNRRTEDAKRV